MQCYVSTFSDNKGVFNTLSEVVCYWIVIVELATFIMGYGAGSLPTMNFVWVSILNYFLNISMLIVLLPVMSCMDFDSDSVEYDNVGRSWLLL